MLSALLGLFVLASATLGVLAVRQGQRSDRLAARVTELEAQSADQQRRLETAERNLRDSDGELADTKEARDAIADCLNAIYDWSAMPAPENGAETPQSQAAWREVVRLCDAAEPFLT